MLDFLGPFGLIIFFAIGIVIGVTIFPLKWLKVNGWLQMAGISLTLFSTGASIAGSPTFLADIKTAGIQALLFAVVTICGSVACVWALSKLCGRGREGKA